jgi:type I restriction enzyme S subunit
MELKHGYKQTEIGVIPEEWDVKQLGSLTAITTGRKDVNEGNPAGEYPFFTCSRTHTFSDHYSFDTEAILIAGNGEVGNLNYYKGRFEAYQRTYVVHKFATPVRYIWHQLNYRLAGSLGLGKIGTSIPYIKKEDLTGFEFPSPAHEPEQRAIATALSDVDGLLGGLDRLIAKKRNLKQAAMQQLLTGQTRLPGFHGEWEVKRLGELGEISGSGVDKKSRPDETPVRLLNYMDVYRRAFIFSEDLNHWVTAQPHQARRCAVQKGDVFFTPSSETRDDIANSAVAMEDISDAAYSYHVVRLRLKEPWDLRFRTYAFKPRSFLNQAETICDGGGTRYVISLGKFRSLTVNVPPVPEQTAIAEVLGDMDAELAALEHRREKTRALKQAMMQELLTGRTRLV